MSYWRFWGPLPTHHALTLSDSVTATDAQAKSVGLSVADSVGPTDQASSSPTVVRTDSVSVTDAETRDVEKSFSDIASITDALAVADVLVLGDSVTVTDDISADLAEQLTKSLADSVTVTDDLAVQLTTPQLFPLTGRPKPWMLEDIPRALRLRLADRVYLRDEVSSDLRVDYEVELLLAVA